jgi:hypothetical protein
MCKMGASERKEYRSITNYISGRTEMSDSKFLKEKVTELKSNNTKYELEIPVQRFW